MRRLALAFTLLLATIAVAHAQMPSPVLVTGDHTRLYAVMDKARRGQTITMVGIGGSITACAGASTPGNCWLNKVASWWTERYGVGVTLVNSGYGGTNSIYGALRYQADVADKSPDFVVFDFARNDDQNGGDNPGMEAIVRRAAKRPVAALVMIFAAVGGTNITGFHTGIASRYGIPAIGYRDQVQWMISQGQFTAAQCEPDNVHPSDICHGKAADFIRGYLDTVKAEHDALRTLATPLYNNRFENVTFNRYAQLNALATWRSGFAFNPNLAAGMLVGNTWDQFHMWMNVGPAGCIYFLTFTDSSLWGSVAVWVDPPQPNSGPGLGTLVGVYEQPNANSTNIVEWCGMPTGPHWFQFVDWPSAGGGHNGVVWLYGAGSSAP